MVEELCVGWEMSNRVLHLGVFNTIFGIGVVCFFFSRKRRENGWSGISWAREWGKEKGITHNCRGGGGFVLFKIPAIRCFFILLIARSACLLYTLDAAADLPCLDPGGRLFFNKKTLQFLSSHLNHTKEHDHAHPH